MKNTPYILLLLVCNFAHASDPSGLYVFFVGIPLLLFSGMLLLISFVAPKAGLVISGLALIAQTIIVGWASSVGYSGSVGGWVLLPLLVNIGALVLAVKRLQRNGGVKDRRNDQ